MIKIKTFVFKKYAITKIGGSHHFFLTHERDIYEDIPQTTRL